MLNIPSGKHTKNDGTSPFLIGTSIINCNFQLAMLNYQRVPMVNAIMLANQ